MSSDTIINDQVNKARPGLWANKAKPSRSVFRGNFLEQLIVDDVNCRHRYPWDTAGLSIGGDLLRNNRDIRVI